VFVVDSVTDSIYRSIGTISPVVIGSVNGDPVPVVRDPHEYIVDANTIPQLIGSGHELAYCGGKLTAHKATYLLTKFHRRTAWSDQGMTLRIVGVIQRPVVCLNRR